MKDLDEFIISDTPAALPAVRAAQPEEAQTAREITGRFRLVEVTRLLCGSFVEQNSKPRYQTIEGLRIKAYALPEQPFGAGYPKGELEIVVAGTEAQALFSKAPIDSIITATFALEPRDA